MIGQPHRSTLFPYTTLFRSYQQIYFHALGTDPADSDRYILGKDFPRIAEITLDSQSSNGKYVMATVARSEEHTSELQSPVQLVCRLLLEKKKDMISTMA